MVGLPLFPGFISKVNFAQAGIEAGNPKMMVLLITLAISTVLNCFYFFRAVINIYTPGGENEELAYASGDTESVRKEKNTATYVIGIIGFILFNLFIGTNCDFVLTLINKGIGMFR